MIIKTITQQVEEVEYDLPAYFKIPGRDIHIKVVSEIVTYVASSDTVETGVEGESATIVSITSEPTEKIINDPQLLMDKVDSTEEEFNNAVNKITEKLI